MQNGNQIRKARGLRGRMKWIVVLVAVVIMSAAVAVVVLQQMEIHRLSDPSASAEQAKRDAAALREKVNKLMQLPDEEATVATVQDIGQLREQEFFASAQNGDKVLIFTNAKKAFIYRESENRVINSGPIVINSSGATDAGADAVSDRSGDSATE